MEEPTDRRYQRCLLGLRDNPSSKSAPLLSFYFLLAFSRSSSSGFSSHPIPESDSIIPKTAYYLPPSSILLPLTRSSNSSYCEWKGAATYWNICNPSNASETVKNRIWSYENPTKGFEAIKGYMSLYAGPWDCFVDGEKVQAQEGDFYGGWVTSDIEGPFKGGPGTWGYVHRLWFIRRACSRCMQKAYLRDRIILRWLKRVLLT